MCADLRRYFFVFHNLNKIQRVDQEAASIITPDVEDFETDTSPNSESEEENLNVIDPDSIERDYIDKIADDELINILLVGQDRREGRGRQRLDAMILCSINPDTH